VRDVVDRHKGSTYGIASKDMLILLLSSNN
jgi:hypothetical protein